MSPVVYLVIAAVGIIVIMLVLRGRSAAPELEERPEPKLPAKGARRKREAAPRGAEPAVAKKSAAAAPEEEEVPISSEPAEEAAPEPSPPPAPLSRRKKDVAGLRKGLAKVRQSEGLFGRLKALLGGRKEIDPALIDEIEEILVTSDVGVKTTATLLEQVRAALDKGEVDDTEKVWDALRDRAVELLDKSGGGALRNHGSPTVVLMVGVNGTGKTTTIGKLATRLVKQERTVLLVAGDTFRAAAVAQLRAWGKRVGCEVFAGKDGADPAAVVFDAVKQAVDSGVDVVLVDTAGRLHTKSNLMDELEKIGRTADKALSGAPHEVLLVVDGTTGQNALQQAETFSAAMDLTGIVLTKLDGTAKGGVVLAISAQHDLPVRYIGVGERAQDLRDFDPEEFVEAMLGSGDDSAEAA